MKSEKARIVIDFSRNLIRIHKTTIHTLGSPDYVLLVVDPIQKSIGIMNCPHKIKGAHKIALNKDHSCELCSKPFITALRSEFHGFQNTSYAFDGEYVTEYNIIKFNICNSKPIKAVEVNKT